MKTSVRYGLILGGIMVALPLIFYGLGLEKDDTVQQISGYLNMAIAAAVIFLGTKEYRDKDGNGFMSFGSGFSTGMTITLIGGAISSAFTYVYFTVINPGMVTYIKLKQEEELLKRGMSDSEVEKMAENMAMWMSPGMMTIFAFVAMLLIGLIISLICGGVLKKEDPSAEIS